MGLEVQAVHQFGGLALGGADDVGVDEGIEVAGFQRLFGGEDLGQVDGPLEGGAPEPLATDLDSGPRHDHADRHFVGGDAVVRAGEADPVVA